MAMSDPYLGEARLFAFPFAPTGWLTCEGQLVPVDEFVDLFKLIGTTYGGDGQETFAVPDLASRVPVHAGQGPGISQTYQIGEKAGTESVTLTTNQIPSHTHTPTCAATGQSASPIGALLADAVSTQNGVRIYSTQGQNTPMSSAAISSVGGSQPHDNIQPSLGLSFIISLFGIFPHQ
jgi:microcystin-dependent protein